MSLRLLAGALAALLAAAAPPVLAQAPGKGKPPARPADAVPDDEVRIRADSQNAEQGRFMFRGLVDLRAGELRIQADELDIWDEPKPDGTKARKLSARGNVVFVRGEERLSGKTLELDLDTNRGVFTEALGYVEPGMFIEAERIERLDADTYRIQGGKFSACSQPNPRWSFRTGSATLHIDDKVVGRNVVFKAKGVPVFYLPIFAYPTKKDERATGFLFPHFGTSQTRGFNIGSGFFWAMGRSLDQTLYLDHYSKYGWGYGHELRYAEKAPSRGSFRSYFFKRDVDGGTDYDLDYSASQQLPGNVRGSLQVKRTSALAFQTQFQDTLDLAINRTQRSQISLQRSIAKFQVQVQADETRTFFGSGDDVEERVNAHLPLLRVNRSPQKLGRTGLVFSGEARAEQLRLGSIRDAVDDRHDYGRLDFNPRLSRPFSLSFLQLTPSVQYRYTRWGESIDENAEYLGVGIDRSYTEASLDARGPSFSRVFSTPGNFYSEKYKHVIGPEFNYQYRTKVDAFAEVPKFDGTDYVLGTNQVSYALVNRVLAKRPGRSGKLEAYEFFNWRLGQTYYFDIANEQNNFDPNYSTAVFGPGGVPAHRSPLQSRMRLAPTPQLSSSFNFEYDVNFHQLRSLSVSASAGSDRARVQASWFRSRQVAQKVENRVITQDTIRGSARLELWPRRLLVEGSGDYDHVRKLFVQKSGRLRYDVQCCGFQVEVIDRQFGGEQDRRIQWQIILAHIGPIGNFLGQEAIAGSQQFRSGGF